jgi:hypothetical protein
MKLVIAIYLVLGAILNFVGPVALELKNRKKRTGAWWQTFLHGVMARPILIVFYPIWFITKAVDDIKTKAFETEYKKNYRDGLLYFERHIPGTGTIKCNRCDFSQDIVGFLHGGLPGSWSRAGVQCQTCGKFHKIGIGIVKTSNQKCNCGGILARGEALFCPSCKSNDLTYGLKYMT